MSFFLRLTGITNAAVWLGTAVFFVLAVWPAFHSREMLQILPPSHSGAAAQVVMERCFSVQMWCGVIALSHLLLEWLYSGKQLQRWPLYLVTGLLGLTLLSGLSIAPNLKRLHLEIYGVRSTPQQREQAAKAFEFWRGVVQISNLLLVLGVWVHVWEIASPGGIPRLLPVGKFRG